MWKKSLIELLLRDILRVKEELLAYTDEANIWVTRAEISNSAGNLALHLVGNLNHFIGATLGNTGYVRTREVEFSAKNVPLSTLIQQLAETATMLSTALSALPDAAFEENFPLEKHGKIVTMPYMLLHLLTHLNYHLGQINYHRRLLSGGQ